MRRRDKQINSEILGIATEAVALAKETRVDMGKQCEEVTAMGHELAAIALRGTRIAEVLLSQLEKTPNSDVLSDEELQTFAEAVPQWGVTTGISNGQVAKRFYRTLEQDELMPRRRIGGDLEHDTYLAIADAEHSDYRLAQIFDSYYISGDYVNGEYFEIRITAGDAGPITYNDLSRILDAEEYLITEGYIQPPLEEEVAVSTGS